MSKEKPYTALVVNVEKPVLRDVTKKAKELYGPRKRSHHVNKVLKEHAC